MVNHSMTLCNAIINQTDVVTLITLVQCETQ